MEDKVVLITGASSGIGAATAEHFADIGYKKLSIVARREEKLREVAEKCKEKGAKDVLILPLDLSDMQSAKSAVEKTVEHFDSEMSPRSSIGMNSRKYRFRTGRHDLQCRHGHGRHEAA